MGGPESTARRRLRHGAARRAAILAWLVILAVVSSGCERPPAGPVDPICGDFSERVPSPARPLARVALGPPFAERARGRRYEIGGRPRDAVTGFRRIPIFERRVPLADLGPQVETITADGWLEGEPIVFFAPRVRVAPSDPWVDLAWVEAVARREGDQTVYDVAFDPSAWVPTAAPDETADVEIGLAALASTSRSQHAWESAPIAMPADGVLATEVGLIAGGRDTGPVAFRALACEADRCTCLHGEVIDPARAEPDGWRARRISLARHAGRTMSIRLETQALREGAGDPGLWAAPAVLRLADEDSARLPNVLMISLDTLAADHLGTYGYPRDTSPYIDGVLARRGTVFLDVAAPATTTGPSHMTLFTSLPPSAHGVVSNVDGPPLPTAVPTLATTLRDAGYVTGAVTENGAISRWLGFGRGFDEYEENLSADLMRPEGHVESTFAAGRDFVERMHGLPWFLFLHTYQVHYPYTPPPAYASLFADDGLDPYGVESLFVGGRSAYDPVLYDREIRYTDDRLGDLLRGLEQAGLLDDTLVVVLGDHGEGFLEHAYLGHGASLHRESLRVPLIFAGPGVPAGRRVASRVGLGDVMPTILDLVGLPVPPESVGRSLVPLLAAGAEPAEAWARPVFSEVGETIEERSASGDPRESPTVAVQRGRYKLIRYRVGQGHRDALYDLERDPFEHEDLAAGGRTPDGEAGRQLAELSRLLDDYVEENARRASRLGVVRDASPDPPIDPERLEKLKALGYVE